MLSLQHDLEALPAGTDINSLPPAGPPPQRFTKPVTGIAIIDESDEDAMMAGFSVKEYRRLCPHYVHHQPRTAVPQNVLLNELNAELHGAPAVFVSAGSAAVQVNRSTQAKRIKALAKKQEEELFQTATKDAFTDGGYIIFSDRFLQSNQSSPVTTRHVSRATSMASLPSVRSLRSNQSDVQLNAFPSPPSSAASSGRSCTSSSSDADSDAEDERASHALNASMHSNASTTEEAAAAAAAEAQAKAKLEEINAFISQAESYQRPMFRRVNSSLLYGSPSPYLRSASA